jgi:hypothetical protein
MELEFVKGDKVFLKVAPMKSVTRFGKKGKLSPRYIGPFDILERNGPVAYRIAITTQNFREKGLLFLFFWASMRTQIKKKKKKKKEPSPLIIFN